MEQYPASQPTTASQPVTQNEMYATLMQEERIRNVISQISPDNQLAELQMRLKGYIRDPITGAWDKLDPKAPEIHPLLISRYIGFLSSVLNQNTTLSNLQAIEINRIMTLVIEWVTDDLNSNAEEYGIGNNYTERTRVGNMLLIPTFAVFKRCLNGSESRRLFGSLNMNDNLGGFQQQKGFLESLKFWKK